MNREYFKTSLCHAIRMSITPAMNTLTLKRPYLTKASKEEMENFLIYIRRHTEKIIKYVNTEHPHISPLTLKAVATNFTFEYIIAVDFSSVIKVTLNTSISKRHDANFILSKVKSEYGFVYFLKSEFGYKIGCTGKLNDRMRVFGVTLPFPFSLYSHIRCKDHNKLESLLHKHLYHRRIQGEWFKLTDEDFVEIDIVLKNLGLSMAYGMADYEEEYINTNTSDNEKIN